MMLFNFLISVLIATSFADENKVRHLRGQQHTSPQRHRGLYTPAFDFVKSTAANKNYCMDMSLETGNNVEVNPCDEEKKLTQTWHFDSATNQIINKNDGKCLDVNTSDHNILAWKCRGRKDNQMWELEDSGTIKSLWNGECLTIHSSNNLILTDCHNGDNQKFFFTQNAETKNSRPFEEKKPTTHDAIPNHPQNEWKPMTSFRSGIAQCVKSFEMGVGVTVDNCDFDEETQNWRYDSQSERILNRGNEMCLDVDTSNGNIVVWLCRGKVNQQWYWDDDNKLRSRWNDECVDLNEETNNSLYLSPCDEVTNQYFYL